MNALPPRVTTVTVLAFSLVAQCEPSWQTVPDTPLPATQLSAATPSLSHELPTATTNAPSTSTAAAATDTDCAFVGGSGDCYVEVLLENNMPGNSSGTGGWRWLIFSYHPLFDLNATCDDSLHKGDGYCDFATFSHDQEPTGARSYLATGCYNLRTYGNLAEPCGGPNYPQCEYVPVTELDNVCISGPYTWNVP